MARDVALQADGKIAVVGDSAAADGSSNFVLARLNADGTPDEAFGVSEDGTPNGFVSTSLGEGNDFATGLAIQTDGKLVVAGYHQEGESTNIAVARYTATGELDQSFGQWFIWCDQHFCNLYRCWFDCWYSDLDWPRA